MSLENFIKKAMMEEEFSESAEFSLPRINIIGVGGAGCNIVSAARDSILSNYARIFAVNTDAFSLERIGKAEEITRILIGKKLTEGKGTSGNMEVGERCILEPTAYSILKDYLRGADLTFVIAGLGGGTGGGAGPVIAKLARETRSLVVSIVTMPFSIEGKWRKEQAIRSLERFKEESNTVIVLENDVILRFFGDKRLDEAFRRMNHLIVNTMLKIISILSRPSRINIDYADLKSIIRDGGIATVLTGKGRLSAVTDVILNTFNNPLLDVDYRDAKAALVHITSGPNITLGIIDDIIWKIRDEIERCDNIKLGVSTVDSYDDVLELTLILTGLHPSYLQRSEINTLSDMVMTATVSNVATASAKRFGITIIE